MTLRSDPDRSFYDRSYPTLKAQWEEFRQSQRGKKHQTPGGDDKAWEGKEQEEKRVREARKQRLVTTEHCKRAEMQPLERSTRELERQIHESAKILEEVRGKMQKMQGWPGYVASWTFKRQDLADQKLQLVREELQAIATRTIRESRLKREMQKLQGLRGEVERLKNELREIEEQDARRRREERDKAWEKEQREQAARAEERLAAARERLRKEQAARERARAARQTEAAAQERENMFGSQRSGQGMCSHRGWWTRCEGSAICESCGKYYRSWILACPSCDIKACASCRPLLQGKPAKSAKPRWTYHSYGDFDDFGDIGGYH